MADIKATLPKDSANHPINRAMGTGKVAAPKLGSSTGAYRDVFDLSSYGERVFHGLSVYNPDTSNMIEISIGGVACGQTERGYICHPNGLMAIDQQSFGPGFYDENLGLKALRLRAKLVSSPGVAATSGTTATGTIGYAATQPDDGDVITVNGRYYEISNDQSVKAGRIKVDIAASADLTMTNFKNILNANDSEITASINTGTDTVTLTSNLGGTDGNAQTFADGGDSGTTTGFTFSGSGNLSGGLLGLQAIIQIW